MPLDTAFFLGKTQASISNVYSIITLRYKKRLHFNTLRIRRKGFEK